MSTNASVETPTTTPNNSLIVGLAMAGGFGILLIIIGFLLSAFDPTISSSVVGLLVLAGLLALVSAIAAWAALVRPFDHFDDINVAQYHGHEHHDDHAHAEHETEGEAHADAPHADPVNVYPAPTESDTVAG